MMNIYSFAFGNEEVVVVAVEVEAEGGWRRVEGCGGGGGGEGGGGDGGRDGSLSVLPSVCSSHQSAVLPPHTRPCNEVLYTHLT